MQKKYHYAMIPSEVATSHSVVFATMTVTMSGTAVMTVTVSGTLLLLFLVGVSALVLLILLEERLGLVDILVALEGVRVG
jgi:hypothetical protein